MNTCKNIITIIILTYLCSVHAVDISRFYPDHYKVQYAGNQGIISIGSGYHFLKHRYEVDLMYGYIPKFLGDADIHSITIKRSVLLFNINSVKNWDMQFTSGISTIITKTINTYLIWPEHYPDDYYSQNAIHHQLTAGLRFNCNSQTLKLLSKTSIYYEVGILDNHLFNYYQTAKYDLKDKINIAIGMHIEIDKEQIIKNSLYPDIEL